MLFRSRVATFETGDLLLQHLEQSDPCDLLIVDIQMPGLDGFAIVHEVRRRPHLAGLPILALTGLSARDAAARIMEAGADAYLRKPVDIAELIRVVDDLVGADVDADTPPDEAPQAESGPDADADADTHADAPADAQVVEEHLRPAAILDALERTAARGGEIGRAHV
mgnify:CR=1 FL=1